MKIDTPVVSRELERVKALATYNIDYETLQDKFSDLTLLAAHITGTSMSLINLMDADTQWNVSRNGIDLFCINKEDSICQYTIKSDTDFEVTDLRSDYRFSEQNYIKNSSLSYYYGVPLKTKEGFAIGALCVLDDENPVLGRKQKNMLQLLAGEVISRLDELKRIAVLENKIQLLQVERRMLAHDIRGPLGGIKGLAEVAAEEGLSANKNELLHYLELIKDSSQSVMELADEILLNERQKRALPPSDGQTNLLQLKKKIEQLFAPKIKDKDIDFEVYVSELTARQPINKHGLQQILGNLVSNAIKFTPKRGFVTVELNLVGEEQNRLLKIEVKDSGRGMKKDVIDAILENGAISTQGTGGETGYGLGLQLVRQIVAEKKGSFEVTSTLGHGSSFTITLPAW
ncbi:HAMP domain-containing sensor histidine kinase [Mucilaginibacter sp. CSA2-8R]|uniref:sensor histidine kinase n=1 Tax=Mucilaginibacter sp. CSA2-8R TaxID=3141542 RepID=UPI00315CFEE4